MNIHKAGLALVNTGVIINVRQIIGGADNVKNSSLC